VGVIEALIQPKAGVLEFERIWCKSNKSQAICMSWSDAMSSLAIGFDSGQFEILTVDTQNPLSYKETYTSSVHKSRVMGIWIDGMRSLCYTISEDKTLKVTDLKVKELIADIVVTSTKLTCLEIDSENKTAFIADRGGQIHIYDLIPLKPQFIQIITTPSKGSIRGLYICNQQQLLFASCFDDGMIHGYKLNGNGSKDYNPQKVLTYGSQKNVRHIYYWASRQELYVGYAGGLLTVYRTDEKNRSNNFPICSMKAHQDDVTGLYLLPDETSLVSVSKDKSMKFWTPPTSWLKDKSESAPAPVKNTQVTKKTPPAPSDVKSKPITSANSNNPLQESIKVKTTETKPAPKPAPKTTTTTTKKAPVAAPKPEPVKQQDDLYVDSDEEDDDLTGWNN